MCGIIGYIGKSQAKDLLIDGLRRLEYRGYDSSGIAVRDNGELCVLKAKGKLDNLIGKLEERSFSGTCGIGHTRWATHGAPDELNAHPHLSRSGKFAIVHNGIIENYKELCDMLISQGYSLRSETDSEVIAHLIELGYDGDALKAIQKTVKLLKGSFALGILCADENALFAVKKDSPLVIGSGEDGIYIASDMQALLSKTHEFLLLESGEMAKITDKAEIFDFDLRPVKRQVYVAENDKSDADKHGYAHFMLKEIYEQPEAIERTLLSQGELSFLDGIGSIHLIGCGSAYHAALMGKYIIESLTGIRVHADIASEFRYRNPIIKPDDLLIAISQSGETADTIGAMNIAAGKCKTACIVNVPLSSLTHVAEPMYTYAGPEIAVATTKGFTTQLVNLYLIAAKLLSNKGDSRVNELMTELSSLPLLVENVLKTVSPVKLAFLLAQNDYAFFIGRGADYAAAKESALKLKEISYIHADCYPAGELKHGTISLIQKGSPVIAIATDKQLLSKTVSNIAEVKSRGAFVIAVSPFDIDACDALIKIPYAKYVAPLLASVATQLLSYHTALVRHCEIDKPRNLAKSVTVE